MAKLSCGGKGPCCHIGYAHRHCEHCDTVIATGYYSPPTWTYRGWPYYSNTWGGLMGNGNQDNMYSSALQSLQAGGLSGQDANQSFQAHACTDAK